VFLIELEVPPDFKIYPRPNNQLSPNTTVAEYADDKVIHSTHKNLVLASILNPASINYENGKENYPNVHLNNMPLSFSQNTKTLGIQFDRRLT